MSDVAAGLSGLPDRLPLWRRVLRRLSGPLRRQRRDLGRERVRSTVSAYVYGNVLVLASVLTVSAPAVASGTALVAVAVTTLTTYAAHVLAHDVAQRIDASPEEHRERVREELGDASPIVVSGITPLIALALGTLDLVPVDVVQPLAAVVPVARLAIIAWRVEGLSGRPASAQAGWSGIGLASAGGLIALAKTAFHF